MVSAVDERAGAEDGPVSVTLQPGDFASKALILGQAETPPAISSQSIAHRALCGIGPTYGED